MRKYISLTLTALLLPSISIAAYNDVVLTTDTVINVGGYDINVSGASSSLESLVVNSDNFSVALSTNSSITVSAPSLNVLTVSPQDSVVSSVCTNTSSTLSLSHLGVGTTTVTITPSATTCSGSISTPTTRSSSGGGRSSGRSAIYTETQKATSTFVFSRDLTLGSEGDDVKNLQVYLNSHGFPVNTKPLVGSLGYETSYFGALTQKALAKFQKTHGIKPSVGYFGPKTRAYIGK